MPNTDTIRTVIGVIGNIISFGLFIAPAPTFMKIIKAKSVLDFKPDPYVTTVLNCAMWTFYGLPFVSKHNVLVLTINSIGLVMEIVYTLIFFVYSTWPKRRRIILIIACEIIFMFIVVFCVLYFVDTINRRKTIVGVICIIFNVAMYLSPLTVIRRVIQSKSVKYMPFLLSLANFCNGVIWVIYALLKWDPFIVIPNGLGTIAAIAQLVLYAMYYRTTNWDEETPARVRDNAIEMQ
ncbi:PREDICTED: bidirectional sugar transporter SWEET5 [Lupinus angustifolius]|uniref:bidirectional sugar transporter SWEET5 n=1 Tax=Lupinus angustifolius TaxID=3871 RepID=UPI00092FB6F5|nr:PREDICTED: bidirectional sugar transporter SWEET5 [Lupinus angustifolius]XP_019463145.1 PREDICTED: bidirectional sugar transporter SWEET5 [Lupinus angustifolius]